MRRLISCTLLLLFSLTLIAPVLALGVTSETRLAACCRRTGKHHCSAGMVDQASSADAGARVSAMPDKCPLYPSAVVPVPVSAAMVPDQRVFAAWYTCPANIAQAQSVARIARDRSRQKRGPPAVALL